MQQNNNIELNKTRNLDDVVSDSIDFFKQNFKPLLKAYFNICGIFVVSSLAIGIINYYETLVHMEEGTSIFTASYFLYILFSCISSTALIITTLSYIAVYRDKQNQPPSVAEVWSYFKYYFFKGLGAFIILCVLSAIGLVFCFLPGLYFFTVLSLMLPIIIIENGTIGYAFDRCFQIIKNNWWTVFGSMIVMSIIVTAVFVAVLIPVMLLVEVFALVNGGNIATLYKVPLLVVSHCLQFLYILPIIALAFNYFSLTEQKDGTSLLARIDSFGQANESGEELTSEEY